MGQTLLDTTSKKLGWGHLTPLTLCFRGLWHDVAVNPANNCSLTSVNNLNLIKSHIGKITA